MGSAIRFLSGLLLGAFVGATLGLMLAPQAGEETQASFRERLNEIVEEGRRAAAERRAELEAQFAQAKQAPLR